MTQAIVARRDGDTFQARLFWLKAARLLDDDSSITQVGFEHGPRGFDDLWVEYDPGRSGAAHDDRPLSTERFQCKWHVGLGHYTHADLADPEFINASSVSFLQRAYAAYRSSESAGRGVRFKLVTNWSVDPNDPLYRLIRTRSHTLNVDQLLAGKTNKSATGRVRELWREHLQIDDAELGRLARTLGFWQLQDSLDHLRELLELTCKAYGLKQVSSVSSTVYDDVVFQWSAQGRRAFDRKAFRQACVEDGLLVGAPNRTFVFGIKSFEHAFDNLEDRCVKVLDLVSEFEERFIRDPAAWRSTLSPRIRAFLAEAGRTGERVRLAIDAHTTLAFVAGSMLDTKSGRVVEVEQRTPQRTLWAPDDRAASSAWAGWNETIFTVEPTNTDIAVAIGITHDVEPKVRQFLAARGLDVRSLLVLTPTSGPSHNAVTCGAHAHALAESAVALIKAQREGFDDGHKLRVHLFVSAPNGFTVYLGRHVHSLKPLTLYEFDFEGQRGGSYEASLSIPNP